MAKLSEFYSDPLPIPDSLWAMFDACSTKHADDISLTVMHQSSNHLSHFLPKSRTGGEAACLQWTFADLRHAALLLASAFQKRGVQRGIKIVTLIPNGIECAVLFWVAAVLQLTLAPLDPRLLDAGREKQLTDYMQRLRPAVVVVPDGAGAGAVDGALKVAADVKTVLKVALAELKVPEWLDLAGLVPTDMDPPDPNDAALAQDPSVEQNGDRIAVILFTSGTSTGQPKGCPRSVRNILGGAMTEFAFPEVPDRLIVHTPNSGALCQSFLCMSGHMGKHLIIPSSTFVPSATLDAIEQHKVELLVAIPVMVRMFEKEQESRKRDLSAVREIATGGDIVTDDAVEKFKKLFPGARVAVGHGMTEGHAFIGWRGYGFPQVTPQYLNILSIGYPQEGGLVRICGEDGAILPRGQAGEMHLGGPLVIDHYLGNAQPEAFYVDERGHWLNTGDRVVMNEEGALFLIGRIKDIIKRVGMSLSPAVPESVLNSIEGVEAAVFGVPHPDFGEVPMAIVKNPNEAADSSQLRKVVTDSLGADYALQDVKSLADIGFETWPLTPSNKVAKHELKSAYLSKYLS